MKTYVCNACENSTYDCTACVFDSTPDNFDKNIMNVFCKVPDKKPIWRLREKPSYYESI